MCADREGAGECGEAGKSINTASEEHVLGRGEKCALLAKQKKKKTKKDDQQNRAVGYRQMWFASPAVLAP